MGISIVFAVICGVLALAVLVPKNSSQARTVSQVSKAVVLTVQNAQQNVRINSTQDPSDPVSPQIAVQDESQPWPAISAAAASTNVAAEATVSEEFHYSPLQRQYLARLVEQHEQLAVQQAAQPDSDESNSVPLDMGLYDKSSENLKTASAAAQTNEPGVVSQ